MIKCIKYKDIDFAKYDTCIRGASFYTVYAESWYLKIVSPDGFDVLMWDDYKAVMPLPLQRQIGMSWVLQPPLCQQLGVFSKEPIPKDIFHQFEKNLHKCRVKAYNFNEENTSLFFPKGALRVNQVLALNKAYEEIKRGWSHDRKRDIALCTKQEVSVEEKFDNTLFYAFLKENYTYATDKFIQSPAIRALVDRLHEMGLLKSFIARDKTGQPVALRLFLQSGNRTILLMSARDKKRNFRGAMTFLIDSMVKSIAGTDSLLDFEGSMLPGVQAFNSSFGAEKRHYTSYSNQQWLLRLKAVFRKFLPK
ncbi:MAG: GNAT family N-acetyltransferase [Niabella sp.]